MKKCTGANAILKTELATTDPDVKLALEILKDKVKRTFLRLLQKHFKYFSNSKRN